MGVKQHIMKTIRHILTGIVIVFSLFSAISIFVCLSETVFLPISFSKVGFINFFNHFSDFKNLYAATIALASVYYWIYQMDNIEKTNKRIETEILDKKKQNSVEESRYFHTKIQPIVGEFYDFILKTDRTLLGFKWDYAEFTDESVNRQNPDWEISFEKIREQIQNQVNSVNFELDSLAANILHGNIDKETIFKLIGKPFCTQIKVMYPFIAGYRGKKRKMDYFNNIVELFNEWEPKTRE